MFDENPDTELSKRVLFKDRAILQAIRAKYPNNK
jgi:hypothetical protein